MSAWFMVESIRLLSVDRNLFTSNIQLINTFPKFQRFSIFFGITRPLEHKQRCNSNSPWKRSKDHDPRESNTQGDHRVMNSFEKSTHKLVMHKQTFVVSSIFRLSGEAQRVSWQIPRLDLYTNEAWTNSHLAVGARGRDDNTTRLFATGIVGGKREKIEIEKGSVILEIRRTVWWNFISSRAGVFVRPTWYGIIKTRKFNDCFVVRSGFEMGWSRFKRREGVFDFGVMFVSVSTLVGQKR